MELDNASNIEGTLNFEYSKNFASESDKYPLIKKFMQNFQYFINNELTSQYKPKNVITEEIIHPEDNETIKKIELIYPFDYKIRDIELMEQFFDEIKRFLSKKSQSIEEFKKYLYLLRKIWIIFNKEEK